MPCQGRLPWQSIKDLQNIGSACFIAQTHTPPSGKPPEAGYYALHFTHRISDYLLKHIYCKVPETHDYFFFFFLGDSKNWTQGFELARQALYYLTLNLPVLFCVGYVWDSVSLHAWAGLDTYPPIYASPNSWS
jgi:hypothetical protein